MRPKLGLTPPRCALAGSGGFVFDLAVTRRAAGSEENVFLSVKPVTFRTHGVW